MADQERLIPQWANSELWEKAGRLLERVQRCVVPIVQTQGARLPRMAGCGVLARIADKFFLLTAAHVLDEFPEPRLSIIAPPTFVGLRGMIYRSVSDAGAEDRDDAAIYALEDECITPWMREAAVGMGWFDGNRGQGALSLLVFGFPASRYDNVETSTSTVTPERFEWMGSRATDAELLERKLEPEKHIGFDFSYEHSVDKAGKKHSGGPRLDGVSGSGIWALPALGQRAYNGVPGKLVGIFTQAIPTKRPSLLVGTTVAAHLGLLFQYRPELRAAVDAEAQSF